ncbi:MAG: hypothetical protein RIQ28_1177, partial [Pseudomonadota bacterium]
MIDIGKVTEAIAAVAQGRASGIREKDGTVSLMLDVSGLDAGARDALAQSVEAAANVAAPGAPVKLLQTAERIVPRLIA